MWYMQQLHEYPEKINHPGIRFVVFFRRFPPSIMDLIKHLGKTCRVSTSSLVDALSHQLFFLIVDRGVVCILSIAFVTEQWLFCHIFAHQVLVTSNSIFGSNPVAVANEGFQGFPTKKNKNAIILVWRVDQRYKLLLHNPKLKKRLRIENDSLSQLGMCYFFEALMFQVSGGDFFQMEALCCHHVKSK